MGHSSGALGHSGWGVGTFKWDVGTFGVVAFLAARVVIVQAGLGHFGFQGWDIQAGSWDIQGPQSGLECPKPALAVPAGGPRLEHCGSSGPDHGLSNLSQCPDIGCRPVVRTT